MMQLLLAKIRGTESDQKLPQTTLGLAVCAGVLAALLVAVHLTSDLFPRLYILPMALVSVCASVVGIFYALLAEAWARRAIDALLIALNIVLAVITVRGWPFV